MQNINQMIVDAPGNTPFCRIRLEATWTKSGSLSGDVDQSLWWVLTDSHDPKVIDNHRQKVQAGDRAHIRVVYVPAARDPDKQIAITTATAFGRLLKNLAWDGPRKRHPAATSSVAGTTRRPERDRQPEQPRATDVDGVVSRTIRQQHCLSGLRRRPNRSGFSTRRPFCPR